MTENYLDITTLERVTTDIKTQMDSDLKAPAKVVKEHKEKSKDFVATLTSSNLDDLTVQNKIQDSIESIGLDVQRRASKQSELLNNPISTLSRRAEDGGEVANALVDLRVTVESLDPASVDFEPGWFSRILGLIPGIGTSLKRYFVKFESAKTVLDSIIRSLEMGQEQLSRDNITLRDDQKQLWDTSKEIEHWLEYAMTLDQQLEDFLSKSAADDEKARFLKEEVAFPLKQRVMDLQQQLAVQRQGIVATELIMRNNKELIRGINRSLNVTVTALNTATTIALALAHQKHVIEKVDSVNKTTSKLIQDSSERLKTQGAEIHKQAASAQIDIQALRKAFADLKIAINDIADFRIKALPEMSKSITELDSMIVQSKETLKLIEAKRGEK